MIIEFPYFAKVYYSGRLFVCKFVYLQHNSKTNARVVMNFLGSIRTVARKNLFK